MKKHLISFHVYKKLQLHSADFEAYLTPSTSLKLIAVLIFYVSSRLFLFRSLSTLVQNYRDTEHSYRRHQEKKYKEKIVRNMIPKILSKVVRAQWFFSFNYLSSSLLAFSCSIPRVVPIGTGIHMLCWDGNWTARRCDLWTEASTDTRCMSRRILIPRS